MGISSAAVLLFTGCQTGAQAFIGGRLPNLCAETYFTCNVTAGCELDADHYVQGVFPGARRVVLRSEEDNAKFRVRLYLEETAAPGSEFLLQLYRPDCSLDTVESRVHWTDVDLIEEAGNSRTLIFDELEAGPRGEHLLEIFSDASANYLLIADPLVVENVDDTAVEP